MRAGEEGTDPASPGVANARGAALEGPLVRSRTVRMPQDSAQPAL